MKRMHTITLIAVLALAMLGACTPGGDEPGATVPGATVPGTEMPTDEAPALPTREEGVPENAEPVPTTPPMEETMPILPVDTPAVTAAIADLAGRLDVRAADIEVVRAEPVTWSDGSLGCPQPGVNYTQALVDGVFIQLRAGETLYSYHGGGSRDPALCELAAPVAPGELPPGAVSSSS